MTAAPTIHLKTIPDGYRGTLATLGHIAALIRSGAKDFPVRRMALDILRRRDVRPKDYLGEIKALFEWVQGNIRYTRDIFRVEVLHSARRMLQLRAGDCDDMAILLGALLESVGHPVRLAITGPDPLRADNFTHIYVEVFHRGRWIALDATMPYPMGWAPRTPVKKIIPIDRSAKMLAENAELFGMGATNAEPDGLRSLIRSVRSAAIPPKDARVKSLWYALRQQQALNRHPWLKAVLRRIWDQGLPARSRPNTTLRMVQILRQEGVLGPQPDARPAAAGTAPRRHGGTPGGSRPLAPVRPVALRPVGSVRPAAMARVQRVPARSERP